MSARQAPQACIPCRTLKRKCTKELPTCSLCRQLRKSCEYPNLSRPRSARPEELSFLSERLKALEQRLGSEAIQQNSNAIPGHAVRTCSQNSFSAIALETSSIQRLEFPSTYFLELENYRPMQPDQLNPKMFVPSDIMRILESRDSMQLLVDTFMIGIQSWLPILYPKRMSDKISTFNETMELGLVLLLLCMKLVSETSPEQEHAATSALYRTAKGLCFRLENSCAISLQLVQSVILIAVYELGHGIFPAAQLTISHAARLGIIMGFHDRKHAPQLFKDADTYTLREEERRTWWAIIILERYMNLGVHGQPLVTPEPLQGTLLPCAEESWNGGQLGVNVPLFACSFAASTEIGSFASTCQASHILGRVLRHRDDQSNLVMDTHYRISEALALHQTLVLLNQYLTGKACIDTHDRNITVALGICYAARFTLYNMYACNEHYSASEPRITEETDMQQASINGLKEITQGVYHLARQIIDDVLISDDQILSRILLLGHCLYLASSEIAWFIREENRMEEVACLREIVDLLKTMGGKWRIAREYLNILEADGSLAAIVV